jgi:hypothetical protein
MRPPAGSIMLFEDEYFFACLCERYRGSESARARADDDCVVGCHYDFSIGKMIFNHRWTQINTFFNPFYLRSSVFF